MDYTKFTTYLEAKPPAQKVEAAPMDVGDDIVAKIAVKSPLRGQGKPAAQPGGKDAIDEAVKVLKPKVMKPRLVKGGNVADSIQELAQKAKYNPPPEVSDLFDFDDIDTVEAPPSNQLNGDETPDQKRAKMTASVIEKLRAGKGNGKEDNSELRKQIRMQLDQFKADGFLVSRVEKMMSNRKLDTKVILDELIVISSQIEMLKELKKRADVLDETPGANKAKLMTLKLRLSDPDRVSEIIKEIEQMEAAIAANEVDV